MDIKDFFPTVTMANVMDLFQSLGYDPEVAEMLAEICCLEGRLPQGAPTSPAISNLVLGDCDERLHRLADASQTRYSRYADDLTFSSATFIAPEFAGQVAKVVEECGFRINQKKTRFRGKGGRMEVTGVVINETLQLSRQWRRTTRATIHHLSFAQRLTRRQVAYLLGIRGIAASFPESTSLADIANRADVVLSRLKMTALGHGDDPVLPNGLTLLQARALAAIVPSRKSKDIAAHLGVSEAAATKRLQAAFRKIGVSDRAEAKLWADHNL